MGLPGPGRLARLAAGTALHVTATGIGLAAGTASLAGSLVAPPVRHARATAGSVAGVRRVHRHGAGQGRRRGPPARLVTGVDDATDGNLERLTEAGKAMFEPPVGPAQPPRVGLPRPRAPRARHAGGRGRPVGAAGRCAASWSASTASSGPR